MPSNDSYNDPGRMPETGKAGDYVACDMPRQPRALTAGVPDPSRCPLCGKANACVPAACGDFEQPCWCAQVTVSAEALARVPPEALNRACLCRDCALGTTAPG